MRPPALLDDVAELLELALGAEERAQLKYAKWVREHTVVPPQTQIAGTHPLLRQLPRLLILQAQPDAF